MPSKTVFRNTTETKRNGFVGIFDLTVGRGASPARSDRFLFGDNNFDENGDGTVDSHDPVSLFVLGAGITNTDSFAGRNNLETKEQDGHIPWCGSGATATEFRVSGKYAVPSRSDGGEIHVARGVGNADKFSLPVPTN